MNNSDRGIAFLLVTGPGWKSGRYWQSQGSDNDPQNPGNYSKRRRFSTMMNRSSPKHFSMIREFHLADFFTLANAACGMGAVLFSMIYVGNRSVEHFFAAADLAPAGLVFDALDGRIARWRRKHSALGRELDSLADIISFGVAPAALGFAAGLHGGWDWIALLYFVCCGVSRLARFNVTAESLSEGGDAVVYYKGTPIPTSVLLSGILVLTA